MNRNVTHHITKFMAYLFIVSNNNLMIVQQFQHSISDHVQR